MAIELHCNSCGKLIHAPAEAAGHRGKCPACGNPVYIPTPAQEIEELPLAPEDDADERRQAELEAERRRLDWDLAKERGTPESGGSAVGRSRPGPGAARPSGGERVATIDEVAIAYLVAIRQADLERAEKLLSLLQRRRSEALATVDRLAADEIPPAAMADVPPVVYHGFLRKLRSQL